MNTSQKWESQTDQRTELKRTIVEQMNPNPTFVMKAEERRGTEEEEQSW